ncbi:MAG: large conductance mechanosensitive channel protein MscL [Myxococcales bacterium]|nr:large conductance mechanosensitive channel protein MscL [Myxococcales bacterium]
MWNDFKTFAFKGNVIDLAVAMVIGAAFTKIVSALVEGIFMPIIGALTPGGQWQTWTLWKFQIGSVLSATITFLVVAFVMFLIVNKLLAAMRKQEIAAPAPPPAQEVLLTEIRDLLKK